MNMDTLRAAPENDVPDEEKPRRKPGSLSVERALSILDYFIDATEPLSLVELSKASNMVKPTVLRCLTSLERSGYIIRTPNARYQLGAKVMQLGKTYQRNFRLEDHVLPVLRALTATTQESTAFHVREGNKRVCLFRIQSPQAVRDYQPDIAVKLDTTSTGLVLQSMSASAGKRDETHRMVYGSSGVNDVQTSSISTAVFGSDGVIAGAITISGPIQRFRATEKKAMVAPLADAADRLSLILGSPKVLTGRPVKFVNEDGKA